MPSGSAAHAGTAQREALFLAGGGATPSRPNFSLYNATKFALIRFAETLAEEVRGAQRAGELPLARRHLHAHDGSDPGRGRPSGWREIEEAQQVRITGGMAPDKQLELALFLASQQSNHISGRLIHVQDDWKKLKDKTVNQELYRLRRVLKAQ